MWVPLLEKAFVKYWHKHSYKSPLFSMSGMFTKMIKKELAESGQCRFASFAKRFEFVIFHKE